MGKNLFIRLLVRNAFLWIFTGIVFFIGTAFLWEKCLVWAYRVWEPCLSRVYPVCERGLVWIYGILKSAFCFVIQLSISIQFSILCFCCAIIIWVCKSRNKRPIFTDHEMPVDSISDAPIKTAAEDEFGREAYIRMLSTLIMSSSNTGDARYIGIFGPWGEGKTSVRFLLEERIRLEYGDASAIIVDFHPWEYSESIDVRMLFFEQLASAVSKNGYRSLSKVSSLLAKHFALTRYNQDMGPVNPLIDWFRWLLFKVSLSPEYLSRSVRELLSTMQQKVIVVVDDLDRLSKEETCRVIRFLKANGDLPNVTYLILADEDYLANAVSCLVSRKDKKDLDCGREYLKKIIPLRCPLPPIKGERLLTGFKRDLGKLLDGYDLASDQPQDTYDWLLSEYLSNARVRKQLLNVFSIKLAIFKRRVGWRKYLGVHIGDLLALTVMEVCEPDVYGNLWNGYMELLRDSEYNFGVGKGFSEQWMDEQFFSRAKAKREVIDKFLQECLGITKDGRERLENQRVSYKLENPQDQDRMLHFRLASQYHFPQYFIIEEEKGRISQDDIEGFLQDIYSGTIPKDRIRRLDESGLLSQLLDGLVAEKKLPTKQASDCYVKTLIYMASLTLNDNSISSDFQNWAFHQSIYTSVYLCLLFYCQDIKTHLISQKELWGQKIQRIGELLLPIFTTEHDVVLTAHLVLREINEHKESTSRLSHEAFFSNGEFDKLCRLFLERIEDFQREGRLIGHAEFFDLFRCWRAVLRKYNDNSFNDDFRSACLPMTQNVNALNALIRFFCDDNREAINPPELIVAIRLDELTAAFGDEGIATILDTLQSASDLPEYTNKALMALKWSLDRKRNKKSYDSDEQMKCLAEQYEGGPVQPKMNSK